MIWEEFLKQVRSCASTKHNVTPPCPGELIERTEASLGPMPQWLLAMLRVFNGAEFFLDGIPFVTVFGIAENTRDGDWSLDSYTRLWRSHGHRPNDWAFGITTYGGLFVGNLESQIREWDTSEARWLQSWASVHDWMTWVIREGINTASV